MIGRGLILLTILSNCVLSLPVTQSQLENEDVEVMKCIVEALADVLSRPRHMPVSQECLVTLKTDDRLVTILRHHNFLKELQEMAVQGGQERGELQRDADVPTPTTPTLRTADDDLADQSMLEALGGPGERSILNQRKRMGKEKKDESTEDEESKEEEEEVKRENEGSISEPLEEWSEGEKREEEEEYEEKRGNSEEEDDTGDDEKRNAPTNKSKETTFDEEDEEEKDKRSALVSHKHKAKEQEEVMKRGSGEGPKQWIKRDKSLKKKGVKNEAQQHEIPHHSKEVLEEEEDEKKKKKKKDTQKSPELKELQMIARRTPEERRVLEEEGSASRKSEEPEIESLAAIESELENVAQKLHELRRG